MVHTNPERGAGASVVMIVDDDDLIREVGALHLEPLGFEVIEAHSGELALALAARGAPDAVLMDVNMGGLDGFDTTAALRTLPGFELVPILFMTAHEDVASIERAYEVGATDYAIKPLNWLIVARRLRYMMRVVELMDQQKSLIVEVQRSQKMEAVATLASGIAHDFNNVLQTVRGTAELVQMDLPEGSAAHADIDDLLTAVDSGSRLIRQLLSYGRDKEVRPRLLDLNDSIRSSCRLLQRALPSSTRIDLQTHESALVVRADPLQIEQVMMNLALNARDAMADGGVIEVRTATSEAGARVTVSDSGCGIGPDALERIFEPFFSTKSDDTGTGLGLAMVRDIVTAHDGRISCRSESGRGTTFTIVLPLSDRTLEGDPGRSASPGHDPGAPADAGRAETAVEPGCRNEV